MTRTPAVTVAAVAVAAALLAAGCGGSSTKTSSTVDWANSVCSATTTWTGTLQDTASSLKDGPYTGEALQNAADQLQTATQTYLDDLKGLGAPDTQAGQDAKAAVDQLQSELQSGADTMRKATENVSGTSDVLNAVSVVTGTLSTMANEVDATIAKLQQLDPEGELQQAFSQADACAALKE